MGKQSHVNARRFFGELKRRNVYRVAVPKDAETRVGRALVGVERTKYKAFYPESVYLSTVVKNLETAEPLSAYSRVRE